MPGMLLAGILFWALSSLIVWRILRGSGAP